MLLLSVLVALCLVGVVPTVSKSVRSHSVMDIRFLPWPAARYPLELPLHNVDCFSEMDRRHIVPAVITYRLENTKRFRNGVCLVRIPTRSRVTVVRMSTNNAKLPALG
uniref:Secreted protein n=1 Tax=Globodera pallida TaxID=36090 RepID=A0A183CPK0_GLOPA